MLKEFEYPEIQVIHYDVEDIMAASNEDDSLGWA